jgi:protein-S-isoprenylcysteine O-methyltransferase Ste14
MENDTPGWTNIASAVATIALVATIVRLFFLHAILGRGPLTIGAQALAVLLMVWARATFGIRSFHATANPTAGGLVTTGPYRYLRHPIYAAVLLFVWSGVLSNPSRQAIALGAIASAATVVRMISEERLVRRRYPEYASYAARTARLVPFIF